MCQKRGQTKYTFLFVNHSITASSSGLSISIPISSAESSSPWLFPVKAKHPSPVPLSLHTLCGHLGHGAKTTLLPIALGFSYLLPRHLPSTAGHLDSCPFHTSTRCLVGKSSLTGPTVISARDQTKNPESASPLHSSSYSPTPELLGHSLGFDFKTCLEPGHAHHLRCYLPGASLGD